MGAEENEVKRGGGGDVGDGLDEEGSETVFHDGKRMRHGGEGVKTFFNFF